jgi:hypothetical protein
LEIENVSSADSSTHGPPTRKKLFGSEGKESFFTG